MNWDTRLAGRTFKMKASAIREILKVASQPGMVSLAGGVPDPAGFPLEDIRELAVRVIDKYPESAFQYGQTEGFGPLREVLAARLQKESIQAKAKDVLVFSGSQGVLDSVAKVLISEGDKVAVEAPTYLGALQAFNPYGPSYVCLESDEYGIVPAPLERALKEHTIKLTYTVPTFQNPTGRTIPLERRKQIAAIIRKHDSLLVEDDPYASIRFSGAKLASIKSMAPENVIYVGSLSKVFAPGLRLGFALAPETIGRWLVIAKQGVDLHTSTFNQALAAEYISGGYLDRHLPNIIELYRPKRDAMLKALEAYFPPGCTWSRPEGGMFVWVRAPEGADMDEVYARCIERSVAFVPGRYFFTHPGEGRECMRLNFSMASPDSIAKAIRVLSEEMGRSTARNSSAA